MAGPAWRRLYSTGALVYLVGAMSPGAAIAGRTGVFRLGFGRFARAMANVVVVGAQWGDEGKGKIVDWLSLEADVVVRFQGGHNAGHTLVIGDQTYKLALLPSGIVRPGKLSVIGNGVVLDPHHLVAEIAKLESQGVEVSPINLKIAENVTLILALHRDLDAFRESAITEGVKIGTTKRGIGPAYEDKVGRRALRLMDLTDPDSLDEKIARLLAHHAPLRAGLGMPPVSAADIREEVLSVAPKILPFVAATWDLLETYRRDGRRILFEGRARRDARRRSWHLSIRHVVEHGRGQCGDRFGARREGDRLCPRHREGLHDARRRRSISDRTP